MITETAEEIMREIADEAEVIKSMMLPEDKQAERAAAIETMKQRQELRRLIVSVAEKMRENVEGLNFTARDLGQSMTLFIEGLQAKTHLLKFSIQNAESVVFSYGEMRLGIVEWLTEQQGTAAELLTSVKSVAAAIIAERI